MLDIRVPQEHEYIAFYQRIEGHLAAFDAAGKPIAMVMATRDADGRLWAWFQVREEARSRGVAIARALLRGLHLQNETVYVACNTEGYPAAERLLRFLGFVPTEFNSTGIMPGANTAMRVWQWQSWPL